MIKNPPRISLPVNNRARRGMNKALEEYCLSKGKSKTDACYEAIDLFLKTNKIKWKIYFEEGENG